MKKQVEFRCVFNRSEIKSNLEKEALRQNIDLATLEEGYLAETISVAAGGYFKSYGSFNSFIKTAIRLAPVKKSSLNASAQKQKE
jgi:hypothetical protein